MPFRVPVDEGGVEEFSCRVAVTRARRQHLQDLEADNARRVSDAADADRRMRAARQQRNDALSATINGRKAGHLEAVREAQRGKNAVADARAARARATKAEADNQLRMDGAARVARAAGREASHTSTADARREAAQERHDHARRALLAAEATQPGVFGGGLGGCRRASSPQRWREWRLDMTRPTASPDRPRQGHMRRLGEAALRGLVEDLDRLGPRHAPTPRGLRSPTADELDATDRRASPRVRVPPRGQPLDGSGTTPPLTRASSTVPGTKAGPRGSVAEALRPRSAAASGGVEATCARLASPHSWGYAPHELRVAAAEQRDRARRDQAAVAREATSDHLRAAKTRRDAKASAALSRCDQRCDKTTAALKKREAQHPQPRWPC